MSNSTYKRQVMLGIFIFLGILIFVAGVFTIGSQSSLFDKKFTLRVVFNDVGGLQKGNNIWLAGMKIGTVKKIEFTGNKQVEVILNVEKAAQPYIFKDALAKISAEGFIGNKLVAIYGGSPAAGTVADGDLLKTEASISTDDMMSTLQVNNKNLAEITGDFKGIAKKLASGEGTLGKLIYDDALMNELQTTITNLKAASLASERTMKNVGAFTVKLNTKGGFADEVLTDTLVYRDLKQTVTQLKGATATASALMDTLQAVGNGISDKNKPVGMILEDETVADDLKQTLQNLKISSEKLNENMEALQHNFLLRGYFRKKKKREAGENAPAAPPRQ